MDKITLCGHYGHFDILTSNQTTESLNLSGGAFLPFITSNFFPDTIGGSGSVLGDQVNYQILSNWIINIVKNSIIEL